MAVNAENDEAEETGVFLRRLKASSDRHQRQAWLRHREAACWNQMISYKPRERFPSDSMGFCLLPVMDRLQFSV